MFKKFSLFLLRLGMGIVFFWAGWVKVLNPEWSAAGYLKGAKFFQGFYAWFLDPSILPTVNFFNKWGLTLIGIALILGIFVRFASFFGIALMVLYFFPVFPQATGWVDEHVIYSLVFLVFMAYGAGEVLSAKTWFERRLHPAWHKFID